MDDRERRPLTEEEKRELMERRAARRAERERRERRQRADNTERPERRPSDKKRKKKRKKKSHVKKFLTVFVIAFVIIAAVIGISYAIGTHVADNYVDSEQNSEISPESLVAVEIPMGASTKTIASVLKENGIIDSELKFRLKSKSAKADGTYNYGTFYLSDEMTEEQIIKTLQNVSYVEAEEKLTIPEGYTANQIAALLDEKGIVTKEDFINEMNTGVFDYDFLEGIPERDNRLEGYLFPDTYFLSGKETAHDIIVLMLNRFEQVYETSVKQYVASSGYTLDELVTIASMVESEAKIDEERPVIAGVIYNRLKGGIRLQIDSTVQYALQTKNEVVTEQDLKAESPYNTYTNDGLPLGPICNPGQPSLVAAVQPAEHNYIYYVLKEQGGSEHTFTVTYDEFLDAKAKYKATFK